MKKSFKAYLALLLALFMTVPALTFSASAAGQVYTIGAVNYVFLGAGETVTADIDGDGTAETYNTYSSLADAVTSVGNGGIVAIVGTFRDPTTNGDNTFKDSSSRGSVTIRGIGNDAVLKFDHTLDFKAPITMENFTLHCRKSDESGNNTKYVFGGGNTVFGNGMKKLGGIFYGNTNGTSATSVVTTFDSADLNLGQIIMSGGYSAVGNTSAHGNYEFIFNNYNCNTDIALGFNNKSNTVYGNVNCYINGGTYSKKNIILHNTSAASSTVTGAISVIFNNGMADGFTVADGVDFVIKSGVNGTASIKTPATKTEAPVFKLTPNEGYVPTINGVALLANADGEYLLSPAMSDTKQTFEIAYAVADGEDASAIFYSVDGVKTGFVKAGGGAAEYNGLSVVAFDTVKSALAANTDKADVTLVIIGNSTQENLNYAGKFPNNLLTITGADENAVMNISAGAHPWGAVKFENITLNFAGAFSPDGGKIIFGEGISGNMPTTLWGGGSSSPHGGDIEIYSGKWNNITVGSDAVTSSTSTKTQSHNMAIYGGDFTEAVINFGSTVETTVPKNMIFTVNGGEFAENQEIKTSNITSVGGMSAVIYNNGMADKTSFILGDKFEYIIKSGENGSVSYDGAKFIITPLDGYAAKVNGVLCTENSFEADENTKMYTVEYIKATGTAQAYTIDGIKTAYVKKSGGLVTLDENGKAYYAYSNILDAVTSAIGGKVLVVGEYSGTLRSYWSGEDKTTAISSYDENSVLTLTELYMWTPLVFENIKISGNSGIFNADSRKIVFGEGVEVIGGGLQLYGSTGAAARKTNITIKSGKFSKVVGGNVGSTSGLSITLNIEGGDFTEATVNLGNESKNTLNGNALLTISGGVFADGQEIKYSNLTTNGGAVAVVTNDVDKTYNLNFADTFDAVVKLRNGGTYEIYSYGSASEMPTLIFTPENPLYAPLVNGTMLKADTNGKYIYTPEASETTSILEVTWELDTTPRAYVIDDVLTSFVSADSTVRIGENDYYTFATLTEAVASLGGEEGKVIIASDVENTGGDAGAFVDTANREPITIEGLTGDEVLSLDGTFGFKGDVVLDKFTLFFPKSLWAKYVHGYENIVFGKDFAIDNKNGANAFFVPAQRQEKIASDINVLALGGSFNNFNAVGTYIAVPADKSVNVEIDGASVAALNFGYGEVISNITKVDGAVNLIISSDTVTAKAVTMGEKSIPYMTADGTYTIIFNSGINYQTDENVSAILDYIVYSGVGGKVTVYTSGTKTTAPTFLLTPDDGYTPKIGGKFAEETEDGYLYTPEFTGTKTIVNVEWISAEDMQPAVYEIDGERVTIVRSGGGVVYYGNESRFAYADINSAISALGKDGGVIKIYGNVQYVDGGTTDTNIFADVSGRNKVTITGIDGTEPCITYYRNADLAGNLEVDNLRMHRLSGSLYDTGFITKGHELILGAGFVTTTDFSQNMTIHGVSGHNLTFTKPQIITIKGGTITRILPGTTWSASTINGDSIINIEGGTINEIFGGSHGGQSFNSIINGNTEINISGGAVGSVYSGGNSKSVLNGNVTVNIRGGKFNSAKFIHGNATNVEQNILNGNSAFIISDGDFVDAKFGNGSSNGTVGEEIFIIDNTLSGFDVALSDKGTVIYYDSDGTVKPAYGEDGVFLGYEIICDIAGVDIVIDGEKSEKSANNIYTIGRGEHTVLFSTLWDVEFDLNGAEGTVPKTVSEYNDNVINLAVPNATKKNHYFNGWSTNKNADKGSLEYKLPNEDSVLYAIWTEIKPEESEDSNIENSDAERIEITSIPENSYETHYSVVTATAAAETDAAICGGYEICYAFSFRGFDSDNKNVADFANGINIKIPKYVIPERAAGEFYRIYAVTNDDDVSLMTDIAENAEIVDYTEDEEYIYFTAYTAGDYTVVLAEAVYGEYFYQGEYDRANGKYTLVLSFGGAEANFGTFGLKYDTELLTLDSFTFSENVTDMGSIAVVDGGFGTYYNENGIYQNTWAASNGVSIEAKDEAVEIGTFVFTTAHGFKNGDDTFVCAAFEDTGIELDEGTLETVYSDGYYLYAPCVPSTDVYCQPINAIFTDGKEMYAVTLTYTLARDAENSFYNDDETGYNNAASIVVTGKNAEVVYSAYESADNLSANENDKAVITISTTLAPGSYTVNFRKNGYCAVTIAFKVEDSDLAIDYVPECGDIKADYDNTHGDGIVDIDDFIRVLRGFAIDADVKLRQVVDIDENGIVSVTDLAIIKNTMSK